MQIGSLIRILKSSTVEMLIIICHILMLCSVINLDKIQMIIVSYPFDFIDIFLHFVAFKDAICTCESQRLYEK